MFIKGAGINLTLVSGQVGFFSSHPLSFFFFCPQFPAGLQFQDEERHKEFCLYLTSISSFELARTLSVLQGSFLWEGEAEKKPKYKNMPGTFLRLRKGEES